MVAAIGHYQSSKQARSGTRLAARHRMHCRTPAGREGELALPTLRKPLGQRAPMREIPDIEFTELAASRNLFQVAGHCAIVRSTMRPFRGAGSTETQPE